MTTQELTHLYYRIGFGISPKELTKLKYVSREEVVDQLFVASKNTIDISLDISELKQEVANMRRGDKKKLRALLIKSAKKVNELNVHWLQRLGTTNQILREKMTLFWANHFVCHDKNILHFQKYNNTLRKHALGDFKEFIMAMAQEASMLKYLNAKQNRKASPNENFARELLELFTLGRDQQYTEKDIKEAARAFTGWNHDVAGNFRFRRRQHDVGEKTFLGKTGEFYGEDIVDIILEQKQCARFICEKIYRYFVNDKINTSHVDAMTNIFYKDYNISTLMRYVILSDWFYAEENRGVKIKSPIELLMSIHKVIPMKFERPKQLIYLQKLMGQHLLFPPNVAGWKGGRDWINPNSMMLRLKLASALLSNSVISIDEKGAFEDDFERFNNKRNRGRKLHVKANWDTFQNNYQGITYAALQQQLIPSKLNPGTKSYIEQLKHQDIKTYCIQLMSLPEYQLC